jgi:multidrug efflux system outer membrane protein
MPSLSTTIPMSRPAYLSTRVVAATLAASIAVGLAGCSTPAVHPAVDVPPAFAAAQASDMEPEAAWWETFHDPVLTDLVRRAARENRDIKIAAERLRAARSGVTVSKSFLVPSVSAVGAASDRSSGYNGAVKQAMPDTKNGSAGLDVSWEVDLSGRLRAGAAAASADALAAEHGVRGVRLLVMTDVASNYFHARRRTAPARHAARHLGRP